MRRWLLFLVFTAVPGLAHAPGRLDADEPFVLQRPDISYAVFGQFVTGEERFVITMTHPVRFATPVELFVPHQTELLEHRPAWAVVGPGLPAPNAEELAALPVPLPAGFGAVVDLNQARPRPAFYENVMRRFFWTTSPIAVVFPKGESQVWVWCPAKTRGKFGVGYGVEEGGGYMEALKDWSFYAY
ncbi:MAG: hypothetical protein Q8N26_10565 [Myxococcales bacterium]|nr:hypothetical protein [Myxococcales bacterium]